MNVENSTYMQFQRRRFRMIGLCVVLHWISLSAALLASLAGSPWIRIAAVALGVTNVLSLLCARWQRKTLEIDCETYRNHCHLQEALLEALAEQNPA